MVRRRIDSGWKPLDGPMVEPTVYVPRDSEYVTTDHRYFQAVTKEEE